MDIYLNSFYPITHTSFGREASQQFHIHPLTDGSIRREPDFEHPLSPISGLCRPGRLGHLKANDILVYKTNASHILTAILQIDRKFDSHEEAAKWLLANGYPLSSNNMLVDPLPLEQSHAHKYMKRVGLNDKVDDAIHSIWDGLYKERATNPNSSYFYTTNVIYNAVQDNIDANEYIYVGDLLKKRLGVIPKTNWRPELIPEDVYAEILALVNVKK